MMAEEPDPQVKETFFSVGDSFSSFENFQSKLKTYEHTQFMQFWKRDARTIESAKKRIDRFLKPELKYYQLKFCCLHGGKTFKPKGKGARHTSTFKQECPVHISLRINESGTALTVQSVCLDHNHDLSQDLFSHLPKQRKLSDEFKEKAATLLKMHANKKMIQQQLCQETGNVILLKDLSNIGTSSKKGHTRNDLDITVKTLIEKYGASVEVYSDEERNFKGLFFQDQQMREAFQAYPEFICLDATYKLLELGLPTYLMLCEDSNGQSEIVAVCLLVTEDANSMTWMVNTFKKHNEEWRKISVFMADKDLGERDVLKQCFPKSSVLICLFHTLRSFRREITCEKMGITGGERTLCIELLQKMVYASSEAEYNNLYEQFRKDVPIEVLKYFNDSWHRIRNEWVMGLNSSCGNFLNTTNNRLESINGKLKQVINRHSSLEEFVANFFIILTALRTERDHKSAIMFQKVKVHPFSPGSPKGEYSTLLTSYALPFVVKQIELSSKVNEIREVDGQYSVETSEGQKFVSLTDCDCIFRKSMLLPCRHMFALRNKLGQPLYQTDICDRRWSAAYYRSTQRLFSNSHSTPGLVISELSSTPSRKLSQHEKFRKAFRLSSELASVASVSSNVHFQRRIELITQMIDSWKCGKEVGLVEIEDGSEDSYSIEEGVGSDDLHVDAQQSPKIQTQKKQPPEEPTDIIKSNLISDINICEENCTIVDPSGFKVTGHQSEAVHEQDLRRLVIPPQIKKRGRPKGNELTTIGLPKKRTKKDTNKKPCRFSRLHTSVKEKVILSWFVDEETITCALNGKLIEEEEVECRPEKVPYSVLDNDIDVCLVRRYFSCDAWTLLESVMKNKSERSEWICITCSHELVTEQSINCESCLEWYHLRCVGLQKVPKVRHWFCRSCYHQ